jgi:hypothetical protein
LIVEQVSEEIDEKGIKETQLSVLITLLHEKYLTTTLQLFAVLISTVVFVGFISHVQTHFHKRELFLTVSMLE